LGRRFPFPLVYGGPLPQTRTFARGRSKLAPPGFKKKNETMTNQDAHFKKAFSFPVDKFQGPGIFPPRQSFCMVLKEVSQFFPSPAE
jgi:hypothetical protein